MKSQEQLPLVRIQLRYPDEDTFVERFAPNVTRGGIFLASRSPYPVGEALRFEVSLTQGPVLLSGIGKVTWVREFDPNEPQRAHGMGVQFVELAPACRVMLDRLLNRKGTPSRPLQILSSSAIAILVDRVGPAETPAAPAQDDDPSAWISDQALKQAIARARVLASQTRDVEGLRQRETEEPVTLQMALTDLPRFIGSRR